MTAVLPDLPDACWPIDHSCCPTYPVDIGTADADEQEQWARADALAVSTLRSMTGFRVGGCPVTVRPCKQGCLPTTWDAYPVLATGGGLPRGIVAPVLSSGTWLNLPCGCGTDGCSCSTICEVALPGDSVAVTEVRLDGVVLDPTAYRVDHGNRLTRVDGDCWPLCQNMNADATAPDTFAVTYVPGAPVDGLGSYAAGLLACEFHKACGGGACALPSSVTQVVRQGVTYTLAQDAFGTGLTGIRAVDVYIRRWNPNRLTQASAVWSPDLPAPRLTP